MTSQARTSAGLPVDDLVEIACPLCGHSDAAPLADRDDGLTIVRCRQCQLAYLNPRPADEVFARLYEDYIYNADGPRVHEDYDAVEARRVSGEHDFYTRVLDLADRRADGLAGRRLLDVGCATGGLLEMARSRGACVQGVEPDPNAVRVARQRWGVDVVCGSPESCALPAESHDVVTSLEVIEHVLDLHAFVDSVVGLLAPGGIWALTTPNFGLFRSYGREYHGLRLCPEHVLYFEMATLCDVLTRHGLEVVDQTHLYPESYVTRVVNRTRQRPSLARRVYGVLKHLPGVRPLVWRLLHGLSRAREQTHDEAAAGSMLLVLARKPARAGEAAA